MEIKEKHTEKAYKAYKEKEQLSCPLLKQGCGGCPMLALPYEEQLRKKQKKIKNFWGISENHSPLLEWKIPGIIGIKQFLPLPMPRADR